MAINKQKQQKQLEQDLANGTLKDPAEIRLQKIEEKINNLETIIDVMLNG